MTRLEWIILQRGLFVFLGLGLVILAMGMMPRLSERAGGTWKVRAGGWTFLLIGILFGGAYYGIFHEINNRRDLYREVFEKYAEVKGGHIKAHKFYFRQV